MRIRRLIQAEVNKLFGQYDVLVAPGRGRHRHQNRSAGRPARAGDASAARRSGFRGIIQMGNLAGLPALVLPCGFAENMPVALQIVGVPFSENMLLAIGKEVSWRGRIGTSGVLRGCRERFTAEAQSSRRKTRRERNESAEVAEVTRPGRRARFGFDAGQCRLWPNSSGICNMPSGCSPGAALPRPLLILALAIGANTAMFSIVDAWLLRPLHFKNSDQIVIALRHDLKRPGEIPIFSSLPRLPRLETGRAVVSGHGAMFWHDFTITGSGQADHFLGLMITADLLDTLGVARRSSAEVLPLPTGSASPSS